MLVTGLNPNGQMLTVNSGEPFYTKDRTHRLTVQFEQGYTLRGRNGSTFIHPHVYIRIYDATGKHVSPAWNGYASMDEAKAALRALSADGRIYDEEGWDGTFVNGEVVLY